MYLTEQQFDRELAKLVKNIRTKATIFPDNSPDDIRRRKEAGGKDIFAFAKTYFPHYIDKPFGKFHKELHEETEAANEIRGIAAPHKFGKSVLLAIIKPIWGALYEKYHFVPIVSESENSAVLRTEAIRYEFIYNRRIINDFGEQVKYVAGAESDFVTKTNCRFLARGYKQKIRGVLHGPYRPEYIIVDDFEDIHSRNPKIAREKLEYIREEAFTALAEGGILVWLANLTSKTTAFYLLKKLLDESDQYLGIKVLIYKALDENQNPLWPEGGYTRAKLEQIKATIGRIGFQRRYQNEPIQEGIKIKAQWFRYYDQTPDKFDRIVVCCDPSWSKNKRNKAIVALGYTAKENRYYIIDVWIRKASINAMIRKLYDLDLNLKSALLFMEDNFMQNVLWDFIPPIAKEYGFPLPLSPYTSTVNKDLRIEKLEPLYENGNIFHPARKTEDLEMLEEQLTCYPDHTDNDGPDVLSTAIEKIKIASTPFDYKSIAKRIFKKIPV